MVLSELKKHCASGANKKHGGEKTACVMKKAKKTSLSQILKALLSQVKASRRMCARLTIISSFFHTEQKTIRLNEQHMLELKVVSEQLCLKQCFICSLPAFPCVLTGICPKF